MLKYAKIIDEKTKQCFVGLNDLDDIYCDEIAYDEDGNPYTKKLTYKEYYESIGMSEMEVEQAVCGQWYLQGYAPAPTPPTKEQIRQMRERAYESEVDPITAHIQRLRDTTPMTEDVETEIAELIAERDVKVAEIKERYPYNEE